MVWSRWIARRSALVVAGAAALGAGSLGAGALVGSVAAAVVPAPAHFGFAVAAVGVEGTYFAEHLRPGAATRLTLRVTSTVARVERLEVSTVAGATDTNTGDGYAWSSPCAGAACWISGLPSSIVIAPGASVLLHARLDVPAAVTAGQYLLGVGVRSQPGAPSTIAGRGDASAVLRVVQEVNVGVAVTIGGPAQLRPALLVTGVDERPGSGDVVASVGLADTGDTFVHSTGTLVAETSTGALRVRLLPGTILPGGRAAVDVGLGRLAAGSYPVAVSLHYGGESGPLDRSASWHGDLVVGNAVGSVGGRVPAPSVLRTAVRSVPVWLWALAGVLVGIAGLLLATRLSAWRQPGRHVRAARRNRPVHSAGRQPVPLRPLAGAVSPTAQDRPVPGAVGRRPATAWITDATDHDWSGADRSDAGWSDTVAVGAGRHSAGANAARRMGAVGVETAPVAGTGSRPSPSPQ